MGSFHGSYSLAAAAGSLLGGALTGSGLSIHYVFLILSVSSFCMTMGLSIFLYDRLEEVSLTEYEKQSSKSSWDEADTQLCTTSDIISQDSIISHDDIPVIDYGTVSPEEDITDQKLPDNLGTLPSSLGDSSRVLMFLSLVGFLAAFGESSIVTWSTVFFDRSINTSSDVLDSLGFTSFMVAMAAGRFSCDFLRRMIGRKRLVMAGGILAAAGLGLLVLSFQTPCPLAFGCIGLFITGMGLSTLIPTMFSSAGHLPPSLGGTFGSHIYIVAGFSYSGSIVR